MATMLARQFDRKTIVRRRYTSAVARGHRRERAAVMDGRAKPFQRREMLGHAVAHIALEAVTRMRQGQAAHQPIARHLGDDRSRCNRGDDSVAADNRLAIATDLDAIT